MSLTLLPILKLALVVPIGRRAGPTGDVPRPARAQLPWMGPPPLPERLTDSLRDNGIAKLNSLQDAALDVTLRGLDTIIHADTGSGKTLCFALPMLSLIAPANRNLQGIVLAPTLELAAQTAQVFNALQPESATALSRETTELPNAPVVVGPPAMMLRLLSSSAAGRSAPLPRELLRSLRTVVVDEADALLMPLGKYSTLKERMQREDHPKEATVLLEQLCAALGDKVQIVAASATVGRPLRRALAATCDRPFELVRVADGVGLAGNEAVPATTVGRLADVPLDGPAKRAVSLAPGISVEIVTSESDNVLAAVHDVLRAERVPLPLLFISPGRSLVAELKLLRQCDLDAVALDEAIMSKVSDTTRVLAAPRADAEGGGEVPVGLQASAPDAAAAPSMATPTVGQLDTPPRLLVATPSGARGLDLPGLDLVIIHGVPPSADSLVHLAGRTARQGACGKAVIITTPEEADARLPAIGSQLGIDLSAQRRHVATRDERLAQMWTVHSKIIHAEEKAAAAADGGRGRRSPDGGRRGGKMRASPGGRRSGPAKKRQRSDPAHKRS